jgi:hypothetical protein
MNDQDWAHTNDRTGLVELKREITECINMSQISGNNTKAQMREKLLEAQRRIDKMISLQKDDPEMVKPKGEGK